MPVNRSRVVKRGSSSSGSKSGGLGRVESAAKRQQAKKDAAGKKWLNIDDGESAIVRVLDVDDDFKDLYVHRVQFERENGSTFHSDVPCLDQDEDGTPCPGCANNEERRYKFYTNVIARDWVDPKADGKPKPADTVVLLSGGITLAKLLNKKHARHGLRNRDIEIEREGVKKDTTYTVEWAEERNTPLSANDKKLAEKRIDFSRYVEIPDFDDFYKSWKERFGSEDNSVDYEESTKRASPFKGERKTSSGSRTTARAKPSASKEKPKSGLAALRAKKDAEASSSARKKTVVRRRAR